jgi:hypothetical protein
LFSFFFCFIFFVWIIKIGIAVRTRMIIYNWFWWIFLIRIVVKIVQTAFGFFFFYILTSFAIRWTFLKFKVKKKKKEEFEKILINLLVIYYYYFIIIYRKWIKANESIKSLDLISKSICWFEPKLGDLLTSRTHGLRVSSSKISKPSISKHTLSVPGSWPGLHIL